MSAKDTKIGYLLFALRCWVDRGDINVVQQTRKEEVGGKGSTSEEGKGE